jgi:hypothetical protein
MGVFFNLCSLLMAQVFEIVALVNKQVAVLKKNYFVQNSL